jgi:porphobilinogen deaminase
MGQGALAVECRQEDTQAMAILSALHHRYFQYRVVREQYRSCQVSSEGRPNPGHFLSSSSQVLSVHYDVGQGAQAVECRQEDVQTLAILPVLITGTAHCAVGQGALAVECRLEDYQTLAIISVLRHRYRYLTVHYGLVLKALAVEFRLEDVQTLAILYGPPGLGSVIICPNREFGSQILPYSFLQWLSRLRRKYIFSLFSAFQLL